MNPLDYFYNDYELAIATQVRMEDEQHAKRQRVDQFIVPEPRIELRRNQKNVGIKGTEAA